MAARHALPPRPLPVRPHLKNLPVKALYADISNRVMHAFSDFSPLVEVYSIDEAWLNLTHLEQEHLRDYGHLIRAAVMQRVGIPVSVGIASTKTLSKIAAEIVKKYPEYQGVLVLAFAPEQEGHYARQVLWQAARASSLKRLNKP